MISTLIVSDYLKHINHPLAGLDVVKADTTFPKAANGEILGVEYVATVASGSSLKTVSIKSKDIFNFMEWYISRQNINGVV